MTDEDLEELLAQHIEKEYAARLTGAQSLQAEHMAHIRVLRSLIEERKTGGGGKK
jgi:hypothetical protein